jgi:hypothetical protein
MAERQCHCSERSGARRVSFQYRTVFLCDDCDGVTAYRDRTWEAIVDNE